MLTWALIFFIIAIIAAAFGFGGIAVAAPGIAKILFFLFLVMFVIFLIMGLVGRRGPPPV
ncbi:TPA: DUF1328 domain-containing protein [Legionella pneumophila]|nr:DUF1328 domain-containing protein [Legionella pneumophila]